jgi:hypothetical protein
MSMGLRNTGGNAIIAIKIYFERKFLNYFKMIEAV